MTATHPPPHHRPIRSFVRREGRLTVGQQRALEFLWPRFGLEFTPEPLDLEALFGRRAPVTLEIGFGNGESLARMAADDPERDFIGVEVHRPGVGHLLQQVEDQDLTNVRVACHDAVEMLNRQIPPGSLDRIQIYFPDPWPKKRHHKRRLVQPAFVGLLASRLREGGILHLATDWEDYARHMLEVMQQAGDFTNQAAEGGFSPRPSYRPLTKFEQRGQRLGHDVWDLVYERTHPKR
ncbi:tRNA (guanosine(46)-N7)-methyltransferase TrmB [Ectothiorhodospira sp. BSL-9]|uniref:tRNA (guanosine(46)-N7)-methyltransferase TrmB n=1 Tax=Ectothiorhodospira sp. BSL-9 TaxID=1442136 RepID=UPI0007B45A34|nr:tRNA (guanosine(46)-N7)-methyltransferase TrmB [Ectothiorhodospira sp. BSL-9]ANB01689.1 tRNA (guanine-N7)-methyltransferase [Ectothiorhodospira sp. BSL-9]